MKLSALLKNLVAAGASPEVVEMVTEAWPSGVTQSVTDPVTQRSAGAERQHRYRQRKNKGKEVAGCDLDTITPSVTHNVTESKKGSEVPDGSKEIYSNLLNLLPPKNSPAADAPAGKYAFAGEVIKLTPKHFAEFRQDFPRIADLTAELRDADAFYVDTPPKDGKWWFALRGWLKKANQAAVLPSRPIQKPASGPTFDEGGRMTSW